MSVLLALLAGLKELFALLSGWRADRATQAVREDGAARAEAETLQTINEGADAQAKINDAPRAARSVGERLLRAAAGKTGADDA
jgi:hypothetical protein